MRKPMVVTAAVVSGVVLAGGTVTASSAHDRHVTRTLHFTDTAIRDTQTGPTTFADAGVDRWHGKVIGYSALTARLNVEAQQAKVNVAVALPHGILLLGLTQGPNDTHLHGRVVGGTGMFKHATGTFSAVQTSETRTVVTVRYTVR